MKRTELVTADSTNSPGTDHTEGPSVSADGRYVAFVTWAPNLIGTTDTCASKFYNSGTCPEIVVHDRCLSNGAPVTGSCTVGNIIASVATDGTRTNQRSEYPVISANGRVVAFQSSANNLDPADPSTLDSIYVRDLDKNKTEFVSVDSFGVTSNNLAYVPSVSADGRFVSFESLGSNLVPGDNNGLFDTFVHDRLTGATERVTVDSNGQEQPGPCPGNGSDGGQLSADGRFVLFQTACSNLVPGVSDGFYHAYVRDRAMGTTRIVDINDSGVAGNLRASGISAWISGDGRFAVFPSNATNLVANDNNNSCDNNGDNIFNENCSDVFMRGLDPNSSSGDLTGDGQSDDTVLRAMDGSNGTVATLCPADQVSVVAGAAAFLRPESAGATTNVGCTGPSLTGPNLNGPGDTDANDDVVHFVSATNVVQNLGLAATNVVLSGLCAGGNNAKQPCTSDANCPSSICVPTFVSALISETGQNKANLNGDNDTIDNVLQVYDLTASSWSNVGQAGDTIDASGGLVAFITPEADQNADLNGDGDKSDRVLQVYDATTKTRVNTGMAADDFVIGSDLDVCTTSPMVAFRSPEAALCTVPLDQATCHNLPIGCPATKCDLNGDGDCCDDVLFLYAKGLGLVSTGQAATPCRLEACDSRLPYRVYGADAKFLTYEVEQGQDLNGNNNATDLILQLYDACKRQRRVISAVDTSNQSSGSAQDPTQQDPRTQGDAVITASNRCYQGSTLLLVPSTCETVANCPANATSCQPELVVAAPGAVPHHDTALVAAKPMNFSIALNATEVVKTVSIKVRNADILPAKEKIGHTVRLSVEPGNCPPLIVDGIDFDPKTAGDQDTVALTGGKTKAAKVRLRIRRDDFQTHNSKVPARCALTVRATTVLLGNEDPTPRNNVQELEIDVNDKNDSSAAVHESAVQSAVPLKLTIGENGEPVTKSVPVKLINGDLGETAGHDIVLSVDQGDCPAGTVALAAPSTLTVAGGAKGTAKIIVGASTSGFTAANSASLGRCTALLTATTSVMGNVEPDTTNNTTHLLIEVNDKTDY
ncbi:MAG: PD40 domain-containing protein [Deltaproteobacteria bacterium]|nr:PD40 domain-containing protein [Deltaproteobacteria bacterium]